MRITWKKQGTTLKAKLEGELDHHSSVDVRRELDNLLSDITIRRIEFDMSGVTFMDSSGLGVILGRYRVVAARGGGMGIKNAPKSVDRILRMAGVYTLADAMEGDTAI